MNADGGVILATLVVYKLLLIGIGVWASRRTGTEADFFIGGRTLGPWVAGLSYAATSSSAWVLLGFTGYVYATGLGALWMLPGIWGGYLLVWSLLGWRLRRESAEQAYVTPGDFLAGDSSGAMRDAIRLVFALLVVFCFLFYIAAQFQAAATVMESVIDVSGWQAVLVGAAVVLAYCLLGGYWAVSVTDTLQGAMMALVAVITPVAAVVAAGGPLEMVERLREAAPPGYLDIGAGNAGLLLLGFALGSMSIGLGTAGQPQLLTRVMSVRDDSARRLAFAISLAWAVAVFLGMATLALAARALAVTTDNPEGLMFIIMMEFFPPVMAGIAIAAVLSAVMSTADSILLSAATSVSHDAGVARLIPHREVLAARLVMVTVCVAAVGLTLMMPATIFDRVLFAWTALGAAFGPVVCARVLDWRPRGNMVIAAMLTGFALAVVFNQFLPSGPGAIWERALPWLPALLLLWLGRRRLERADA
ncbi:MAG: sodium/proline symporter [Chromatiales bacterium]|nr:sodium/proline symporter [Chromatiales bacterium]